MLESNIYVPQGMFVCLDLKTPNGVSLIDNNTSKVYSVFTDNLLSCSCFFIRDKNNHFCIFAHVDAITNIIDGEDGIFAVLQSKIKKFRLEYKNIEFFDILKYNINTI